MTNNKQLGAGMSRREFVGALGVGLGSACVLGTLDINTVEAASAQRVILFDSSKCVGCHFCEAACRNYNDLPGKVTIDLSVLPKDVTMNMIDVEPIDEVVEDDRDAEIWLRVTKKEITLEDGTTETVLVRHSCTHCGLCAQVCPSKAIVQRDDGIVTMDPNKCIGCHYCYQACPFDIPRYRTGENGLDKAMQKCNMCYERIDIGEEPACVQACPVDALTLGYREEIVEQGKDTVSSLVSEGYSDAYLYGDKELGGTGLMYALPYSFDKYGLPKLHLEEQTPITWRDFVAPLGWGVVLAALAFGGIEYIKNRRGKQDKEQTSKDE